MITSVNYPSKYEPNSRCVWQILTEPGTYISVNFRSQDFDVPAGVNCRGDHVNVYDGRNGGDTRYSLATFCNHQPPHKDVYASFNKMTITFETDESMEGKGFVAEYHARKFEPKFEDETDVGKCLF